MTDLETIGPRAEPINFVIKVDEIKLLSQNFTFQLNLVLDKTFGAPTQSILTNLITTTTGTTYKVT